MSSFAPVEREENSSPDDLLRFLHARPLSLDPCQHNVVFFGSRKKSQKPTPLLICSVFSMRHPDRGHTFSNFGRLSAGDKAFYKGPLNRAVTNGMARKHAHLFPPKLFASTHQLGSLLIIFFFVELLTLLLKCELFIILVRTAVVKNL
jgi:hypothetical protein